jgi:hypothetical protein
VKPPSLVRMLANFQTNLMLLAIFIGLERAMMDFLSKNHHLGIIFPASPNDVRLTSKLFIMYKMSFFYKILSDTKSSRGALECYMWKAEFWPQNLGIFFDHVPYIPYLNDTWKVKLNPNPQLNFSNKKNFAFLFFSKNFFFQNLTFFRPDKSIFQDWDRS